MDTEASDVHYMHAGGRHCTLVGKYWKYGDHLQFICRADHPVAERGEFGMPGLGVGKVFALDDESAITHPPESMMRVMHEYWGFQQNTFAVEHGNGNGQNIDMPSEDAAIIFNEILPRLLVTFLEKNRKYALVEDGYSLGDQGIIPDLNRKLGIIISRVWFGEPEVGESTDEVAADLIGHLLLFLAKRKRDE